MRFVEDTGANWAATQIRAVEMEIEKQKREWEEKQLLQRQQDELEKQRSEKEENEILTYSREDALNKVNIKSKMKSQLLAKRKLEHSNNSVHKGKKQNGTEITQNGVSNNSQRTKKFEVNSIKPLTNPVRRNTRNSVTRPEEVLPVRARNRRSSGTVGVGQKSDRSSSMHSAKSNVRSTSESTSRSTADSMSHRTVTRTPDESDSECSLDVMIDSNDVNDSDSNSNAGNLKMHPRFASTSQDDETLHNDDSTMTDDTTLEKMSRKSTDSQNNSKVTSSPRTRSRGTVKINLWTLDESPIIPIKRQKTVSRNTSEAKVSEEQLKEFGVKDCEVSVIDIHSYKKNQLPEVKSKPSPKARRLLNASKGNQTLDNWVTNKKTNSEEGNSGKEDTADRVTRQRRTTVLTNKTL